MDLANQNLLARMGAGGEKHRAIAEMVRHAPQDARIGRQNGGGEFQVAPDLDIGRTQGAEPRGIFLAAGENTGEPAQYETGGPRHARPGIERAAGHAGVDQHDRYGAVVTGGENVRP